MQERGGVDLVIEIGPTESVEAAVDKAVERVFAVLYDAAKASHSAEGEGCWDGAHLEWRSMPRSMRESFGSHVDAPPPTAEERAALPDYTRARHMQRPQVQDVIASLFTDYVELSGDGKTARDPCLRGGLARLGHWRCVVLGTCKGHTPSEMQSANYGMPSPAGYRTALKLFALAERFSLPVITFVDTVGAWPSFAAEEAGQSEAIATNLLQVIPRATASRREATLISRPPCRALRPSSPPSADHRDVGCPLVSAFPHRWHRSRLRL